MTDTLLDALCYLICVGGLQTFILVIAAPFLWAFRVSKTWKTFAVFNLWLLLFGLMGNFVWNLVTAGSLYVNHPDEVFIPFIPPGDWTIDPMSGGHLTPGVSWWQMFACWFVIALCVWVLTIAAYRRTKPILFQSEQPQAIPSSPRIT